jgi:hypothetical protein
MHFPLARRYLMAGYALRRATWTGAAGEHELAWVTYRGGLYLYRNAAGLRVVRNTDVDAADLRAWDWTMLGPECDLEALICACAGNAVLYSLPSYPVREADAVTADEIRTIGELVSAHIKEEMNWAAGYGGGYVPGRSVTRT